MAFQILPFVIISAIRSISHLLQGSAFTWEGWFIELSCFLKGGKCSDSFHLSPRGENVSHCWEFATFAVTVELVNIDCEFAASD